ncbi:hypothetical protein BC939DRAFT_446069, partial [Gamsiella multidivaricata]|uniref:uncharacterized protein n=1 Tax=Gamsiella multidivaricata TaxID=101098 RepID=UPI00221EB4B2
MAPPPVQDSTQSPSSAAHHNKTPHHNLAVNQKAEASKVVPEGQPQSIEQIESQLPPLRGPEASVTNYVARLEQVEDQLMEFYNGNNNRFKKNTWDMERAKHIEYQAIANSLLKIVGGSIGERCKSPVLIGVGLGDFRSSKRLSSLHGTFLSYFIPLARSLGYVVVGIEEYYTSKKCPNCEEFVAQ